MNINAIHPADANDNPLIQLKGIYRYFTSGTESVAVLKNISLSIHSGEMVAIIGASGSGKSTLMNIIGCLDKPTQGEMSIYHIPTRQASSEQLAQLRSQYIGFIFQRYHLMPYLTATENVVIPALYTAMNATERHERAVYLLRRLGLGQHLLHKPAQLSGGQQQRVSIAQALMNGAGIILADEPTGALDRSSGQELMGILHGLHQSGHTIIIVTHDRNIANQAQRIIEISDGEIIADLTNEAIDTSAIQAALPAPVATGRPHWWVSVREAIKMAWRALLGHRIRALLSMLGIIIGISSVVSSMAVGEGARQEILNEISQLGTSNLDIRPGLGWDKPRPDFERALSQADIELLSQQPYVDSLSPVVSKIVAAVRGDKQVMVSLSGVSHGFFQVKGLNFSVGDGFTQSHVTAREPVVILQPELSDTLFAAGQNPLGEIVQLDGIPLRVIGVAKRGGSSFGGLLAAWMPYTSLTERISGDIPQESITVRVREGYNLNNVQRDVEKLLESAHGQRDFFILSNDQMSKAIQKTSDSMTLLITSIAAISLLVGGVGVMNIMLVSVTERTHEIGIRLSVGARPSDIMTQFLIEAVVICTLGGLIGIVGSALAGVVFSWVTQEFTMIFTWPPLVLACSFSALIGLGFGFFPARNAARLHPTEALARE
ncbi:TPA: ABC transporter permease [Yersinia enterocolitica]|uniref:ABC transporter permease n=1 Tax=Yersinia enterocolitica TaxID=630 RepID=UPI0032FAC6E4|nr:ABC transporter permease [Yersinia enterocolitica]HDL7041074.1 ABC transporter permease [Yersinia enterocolitica]HDL7138774.1 ABC transporter permease [Yersinia enterocolitica]HDL7143479.1 ABC transporter permease [Yersinia enterocolitica]HDL7151161.1 ABC transporter permease [Yersinia enterocolitica]